MALVDWRPDVNMAGGVYVTPIHLVKKGAPVHAVLTNNVHTPASITEVFDVASGSVMLQIIGATAEHPSGSGRYQMQSLYNADAATYGTWHWADDQALP